MLVMVKLWCRIQERHGWTRKRSYEVQGSRYRATHGPIRQKISQVTIDNCGPPFSRSCTPRPQHFQKETIAPEQKEKDLNICNCKFWAFPLPAPDPFESPLDLAPPNFPHAQHASADRFTTRARSARRKCRHEHGRGRPSSRRQHSSARHGYDRSPRRNSHHPSARCTRCTHHGHVRTATVPKSRRYTTSI